VSNWSEIGSELGAIASLRTVYMENNPVQTVDRGAYRRKMMLALPQVTQIDALLTTAHNVNSK
jgi:protein phosphatase 1 regulatory subunit 7